jgi:cytoskeletal protein CcmA (bactofilin family)
MLRARMALFSSKETATIPPRPAPRPGDPQPAFAGTYFGPNVVIDGTVSGSEPVVVEGTIKGRINVTNDLRIGTKARVEATVHAKNVTVEGKLTGDVSADERVELVASATVDGNIKAPKIVVAEGARFRGAVDMGSARPHEAPAHEAKAK